VLPLAMLLCERWSRRVGRLPGAAAVGPSPRAPAPALAVWIVLALAIAAAAAVPRYRELAAFSASLHAPIELVATQLGGLVWLVGQASGIAAPNADPALPVRSAFDALGLAAAAGAAVALLVAVRSWRRGGVVGFAIAWFALWLAPTQTLVPRLDVANDRALYLALIGPAWLVGWALASLQDRLRGALATAGLGLALAVVLAAATHSRNRVYASEVDFWQDVAAKSPASPRAHNNLGIALALSCRRDAADAEFARAIEIDAGAGRAALNRLALREGWLPGVPLACER